MYLKHIRFIFPLMERETSCWVHLWNIQYKCFLKGTPCFCHSFKVKEYSSCAWTSLSWSLFYLNWSSCKVYVIGYNAKEKPKEYRNWKISKHNKLPGCHVKYSYPFGTVLWSRSTISASLQPSSFHWSISVSKAVLTVGLGISATICMTYSVLNFFPDTHV